MLQAFVVTLREGIEAFLIVAISLSYLQKTGRNSMVPPVYWGIGVSVITSVLAGYLFSLASNQALWEGSLAIVASLLVGSLVLRMWRAGRTLTSRIHAELEASAVGPSTSAAWLGIFFFIVLMITREGMETSLLLGTLIFRMSAPQILTGAVAGIIAAAGIALLWARYGGRVDLPRFLRVTSIFLLIFVAQLLIYGVHELAEANVFPSSQSIHDATEAYGPDGIYGKWLTYGLVFVPLGWLLVSYTRSGARRDPWAGKRGAAGGTRH